MTRQQQIREQIERGEYPTDIARMCGCSLSTVYNIANRNGLKVARREYEYTPTEKARQIAELIGQGMTYREIERITGSDQHNVRKICLRMGIAYTDEAKRAEQLERVKSTVQLLGFNYVGGYTNNLSRITLRCKEGHTFERLWTSVNIDRSTMCPECRRLEAERKATKRAAEAEANRLKSKTLKGKQRTFTVCPVCGAMVLSGKYCSEQCRNRAENKGKDIRRRHKLARAERDPGITVEALYRRDHGICYLCGKPCDFDDYRKDGETFVVGDTYPSIDHVHPLSKGGSHTWDNVKLAHHRCNTLKSDKIYPRPD